MPGTARILASPHVQAGGYTPGRSEKLGRVSRNSPRGSREKMVVAEAKVPRGTF